MFQKEINAVSENCTDKINRAYIYLKNSRLGLAIVTDLIERQLHG
jgi:hypothetical protein